MNFPAFKEWHVIVEALGSGEQILILRKGGISENPGGFQVESPRFWLFPTRFHAQLEKTKPSAARWFDPSIAATDNPTSVELRYFAEVTQSRFLNDWETIARLDAHHFWTTATIRDRFEWSKPDGLHAIIVRVHRVERPVSLPITSDLGGCKSWVSVPVPFDAQPSTPVLNDDAFRKQLSTLSP